MKKKKKMLRQLYVLIWLHVLPIRHIRVWRPTRVTQYPNHKKTSIFVVMFVWGEWVNSAKSKSKAQAQDIAHNINQWIERKFILFNSREPNILSLDISSSAIFRRRHSLSIESAFGRINVVVAILRVRHFYFLNASIRLPSKQAAYVVCVCVRCLPSFPTTIVHCVFTHIQVQLVVHHMAQCLMFVIRFVWSWNALHITPRTI